MPQKKILTNLTWILCVLGCSGLSYGLFSLLNNVELDELDLGHSFERLWGYWGLYFLIWMGLSFFVLKSHHKSDEGFWRTGSLILICSLMLRVSLGMTPQPQLSTDIWRYLQDGASICEGVNPYEVPPSEVNLTMLPPARQEIVKRINHPDLASIYLPTSQWVFAGLWQIKPTADRWGDHTFRMGYGVIDCVTILFLLLILKKLGKNAWWAAIYGFHPLALSEVATSGHQDAIGICLLVMGLYFGSGEKIKRWDGFWMGICIGLSIWVKPIAGLVVVTMVVTHWGEFRAMLFALLGGIFATAIVWLPLFLLDGSSTGLFVTAKAFSGDWAFNGPIHYMINTHLVPTHGKWFASGAAMIVVAIVMFRYLKRDRAKKPKIEIIIGCCVYFMLASLLMTSTCHPWYLIWLIALLPLHFSKASWVWSLTIVWSYAFYQLKTEERFEMINFVTAMEYLPVYCLLLWGTFRRHKNA